MIQPGKYSESSILSIQAILSEKFIIFEDFHEHIRFSHKYPAQIWGGDVYCLLATIYFAYIFIHCFIIFIHCLYFYTLFIFLYTVYIFIHCFIHCSVSLSVSKLNDFRYASSGPSRAGNGTPAADRLWIICFDSNIFKAGIFLKYY